MLPVTGIDYFDTRRHKSLRELLAHAKTNYENIKHFARLARKRDKNSHRNHELAIEDKAHFHSIMARADALPIVEEGDVARLREIRSLFVKSRSLKV